MGEAQRAIASGNRDLRDPRPRPGIESPPGAPPLPEGGGEVSFEG